MLTRIFKDSKDFRHANDATAHMSAVLVGQHWWSALVMTLADEMRMDHTTLWRINTSMRNAWFCSALSGCIQQHSSASIPTLTCMLDRGCPHPHSLAAIQKIKFWVVGQVYQLVI